MKKFWLEANTPHMLYEVICDTAHQVSEAYFYGYDPLAVWWFCGFNTASLCDRGEKSTDDAIPIGDDGMPVQIWNEEDIFLINFS